ncbi:LON peptidase N-terminal domain and RING finger protein 2 [Rhopalosiphum padi]|uniref:LON peptidase N-terminal domain and RING finger protein 2 n=1 Tax=Rhopalosiphum padi TaxID=40932 RepID=UPI00298E1F30|nr:LON peptidase N-terminal domain and RING finger protein 2 [Rhopalosiphum padi]
MSFFIQDLEVSINDFMAKVVANDKFSGLYISTYGGGGQQHHQEQQQQQQQQLQQQQQQEGLQQIRNGSVDIGYNDLDACIAYADSVAKCGRVCESLDLYARCFRMGPLPADCLWHVTSAFLDLIRQQFDDPQTIPKASSPPPQSQQQQQQHNNHQYLNSHIHHYNTCYDYQQQQSCPFACCVCNLVLREPVTLLCGHTCCRRCGGGTACKPIVCNKCGIRTPFQPHVDVLVKSLVEKLWPVQLRASELLDEGKALYRQDKMHSALIKFNQAYYTGGENYDLLNVRSRTLLKLGLNENALLDAVRVVQIKPKWSKGHFTRGMVLFSLKRYQEALLEFSLSAVLGENHQKLKSQINEVLQRLLTLYSNKTDDLDLEGWNPISHSYLRSYLNTFINRSNVFDKSSNSLKKSIIKESTFMKKQLCEISTLTELVQHIFVEIMQAKHYTTSVLINNTLNVDVSLLDETDFNCVLCCGMLRNPVTTPCGHTYCLDCLEHNFDYSFHCPLCLTSLPPSLALSKKNTSEFVNELICHKYTKNSLMQTINWKPEAEHDSTYLPVFVCTNAFPSVSCPLHVFEPRYRLMIRRCIESGTRRFAMISNCCPPMKFAEFGTVLEIKDRIMMGNGCSFLSTVGMRRFKVLVRKEHDGYDMATVQYIQDEKVPSKKLSELYKLHDDVRQRGLTWFDSFRSEIKSEILRTVGFPPNTEPNWEELSDGPAWTWWLLSLLPLGQNAHVDLLANTSIEVRLKVINKILSRIERSSLSLRITSSPL